MHSHPIKVSTFINADINEVWRCWTHPEHIVNWNFASEDWHCPKADNQLHDGGRFSYTMAAKDASHEFDFTGTYEMILPEEKIVYTIDDGRRVEVLFEVVGQNTSVTEYFEPERTHSEEMQKAGWQAILNQFKHYVESRK